VLLECTWAIGLLVGRHNTDAIGVIGDGLCVPLIARLVDPLAFIEGAPGHAELLSIKEPVDQSVFVGVVDLPLDLDRTRGLLLLLLTLEGDLLHPRCPVLRPIVGPQATQGALVLRPLQLNLQITRDTTLEADELRTSRARRTPAAPGEVRLGCVPAATANLQRRRGAIA